MVFSGDPRPRRWDHLLPALDNDPDASLADDEPFAGQGIAAATAPLAENDIEPCRRRIIGTGKDERLLVEIIAENGAR